MKGPTANEKRLKLFENRWLEKLTVVSVRWFIVTWAVLIPLVALIAWGSASPLAAAGLVLTGLLGWTLFEYVAHRHLFHWITDWLPAQQFVFVIHGNHHTQPRDLLRNLMPPIVSVPVNILIWGGLYAAFGSAGTWIFLGFVIGYVGYDLTHYACHQWPMRGRFGAMMKRHHMRHHFSADEGNFAITGLFWDRVFGTRVASRDERSSAQEASGQKLQPAHPAE